MSKTFPVYARLFHLKRKIVDHGECTLRLDENEEHIYMNSSAKAFNKYSIQEFEARKLQNPDPSALSAIIPLVFNENFDIHWELTVKRDDFLKLDYFIEAFNQIIGNKKSKFYICLKSSLLTTPPSMLALT